MRRGFLISSNAPPKSPHASIDMKVAQPDSRTPLGSIQPPPPAKVAPTTTIVPIPEGHVGCCEHVGISELLKIITGESTTPPQPTILQIPSEPMDTRPSRTMTTCTTITIPEAREKLLSKGPYPAIDSSEGCRIRVVDVPGKGQGCISTGPIPRGALIIRERPLVVAPTVMTFPRGFDRTIARTMPPNERAALLSLNNCYEDKIIGVLRTNNWGIGALPGHDAPYGATSAIISRINHRYEPSISVPLLLSYDTIPPLLAPRIILISCAPNALFRWNEDMFAAEVRALRPIARGEEVTMCYVPELDRHSARQTRLRDAYGFTCTCELCARPPSALTHSDALRAQLEGLTAHGDEHSDARIWAWARDRRHTHDDDALLEALEQQAKTMEREMYVRPEGWLTVARPLVKIYCALGNAVAARKWAVCAASYARAATGTDGGWEAVARAPEQTLWWGVTVSGYK